MSAQVGWEFPEIKRRVLRPHDKRQSIAVSGSQPISILAVFSGSPWRWTPGKKLIQIVAKTPIEKSAIGAKLQCWKFCARGRRRRPAPAAITDPPNPLNKR
jgi:hypothetical protein